MQLFTENVSPAKKGHFIYFYNEKSKRSTEWDLMRFIAVKSFAIENPEYSINFYTNLQPAGEYWERSQAYCNLHIVEPPREIFGNPLIHPAHSSDIFRIRVLSEEGGVYNDFDTITVKSFDSLLTKNKFLLGDLSTRKLTIGNGVIVSPVNSSYLTAWLEMWKGFRSKGRDKYWDELSVRAHRELVKNKELEGSFEILSQEYFYPYSHYKTENLFHSYRPDFMKDNTYSVHLYDSQTYKDVNLYTEKEIIDNPEKSSYTWITYKYLSK